ncbi:hypothetical protein N7455_008964 [Penicillium solitum]|uniref:uncharacterized protein n=1 Tax=Penicillium solitum TaxID=60172 RepID=UPI0017FC5A49|nr:hypothetical protein HAV15_008747 [Penicillium sp. str. \
MLLTAEDWLMDPDGTGTEDWLMDSASKEAVDKLRVANGPERNRQCLNENTVENWRLANESERNRHNLLGSNSTYLNPADEFG